MTLPPAGAVYHIMLDPVTVIFAIVGFVPLQKVCVADPPGGAGVVFTITDIPNLVCDSHPLTV